MYSCVRSFEMELFSFSAIFCCYLRENYFITTHLQRAMLLLRHTDEVRREKPEKVLKSFRSKIGIQST